MSDDVYNKVLAMQAEIERLRDEERILRIAHSELCANNGHMSNQIKTKNKIISDQHAEIEWLRKELERMVRRASGIHGIN